MVTLFHAYVFHVSPPSTRPWDPLNDLIQFEKDGCIQTKVRHRTPMVRSGSLISLSNQGPRRDNCKYQVGHPGQTPPPPTSHLFSKKSHSSPQPPSMPLLLQRHHRRLVSLCRHYHCRFRSSFGLALFTEFCCSLRVRRMWLKNPLIPFLYLIGMHLPDASRVFVIAD